VRFSNRYVLCQIVYAEITGDKVLAAASSKELAKHGLSVGLKNYSAAYCTGLLVARRLLQKLKLDEIYTGNEEVDGEIKTTEEGKKVFYVQEVDEDKRPFKALLDVGIKATTTGARVFAALKGASDGGLDIPHSHKRFPGYSKETNQYEAEVHKGRIFGEHVADYMREMEEDDEENYQKHFAKYLEVDVEADDLEELYEKVHASIRADPSPEDKTEFKVKDRKSFKKGVRKTSEQRKADAQTKKMELRAAAGGGDDDDMDEDEEDDDEE
jgi:large subunit ribosomal protein L5e